MIELLFGNWNKENKVKLYLNMQATEEDKANAINYIFDGGVEVIYFSYTKITKNNY